MAEPDRPIDERNVRAVRVGHGANCSSIGSVVDTLFAAAVAGSAVFAAVVAALKSEPVRIVGAAADTSGAPPTPSPPPTSPSTR